MTPPELAATRISKSFSQPVKVTKTTHKEKPALRVERSSMYDEPTYTGGGGLLGMLTLLQTACGGNRVDGDREDSSARVRHL